MIDGWLRTASWRDIKLLLVIWVCAMLLPWVRMAAPLPGYVGNYGHMGIGGEVWNPYGMFYYMSGFAGYMVLVIISIGGPLDKSRRKMVGVLTPMFVAGYVHHLCRIFGDTDLLPRQLCLSGDDMVFLRAQCVDDDFSDLCGNAEAGETVAVGSKLNKLAA